MQASALVQTILTFVAIVGVGALLRAAKVVKAEDARPLHAAIIYVGLPAFIFRAVQGAEITLALAGMVAVAWVVTSVMIGLGWLAARSLKLPPRTAGALILVTAWGNTGFIGYPVTAAIFGEKAVPPVVFSDVFGTVFSIMLVGLLIAKHYGSASDGKRLNPVLELVTFPAVIALFLALLLRGVSIPIPVSAGIDMLANMVAPLIMLTVGIALKAEAVAKHVTPLGVSSVLRLAVAPLIALGVGALVLGDGLFLRAAVLEASVPAMMLTLVIGDRFDLDTEFIASAIFVTTALSALSIPLVQLLAF